MSVRLKRMSNLTRDLVSIGEPDRREPNCQRTMFCQPFSKTCWLAAAGLGKKSQELVDIVELDLFQILYNRPASKTIQSTRTTVERFADMLMASACFALFRRRRSLHSRCTTGSCSGSVDFGWRRDCSSRLQYPDAVIRRPRLNACSCVKGSDTAYRAGFSLCYHYC